ncbi:MAG: SAM-dependent methyltransferase [Methyloprofundus sp.]|nr:SAM-dependent methyltransferase [Methyloprofundus sp.]
MGFNLQQVVPWGRSFTEYSAMFTLDEQDLQKSIIGIGDGPASFNAELTDLGGNITSVDPVYAFSSEQVRQRIAEIFDDMLVQVSNNSNQLRLDKFGSAKALGEARMQAMNRFLLDFDTGKQQGRYLNFELPVLPFSAHQFELALCSHLLFLYSEQLDLDFHIKAVLELCRVAKEVRLFPLLDLSHQPSAHLKPVMQALEQAGFIATIEGVDYEFQIGAKQMLRIQSAI